MLYVADLSHYRIVTFAVVTFLEQACQTGLLQDGNWGKPEQAPHKSVGGCITNRPYVRTSLPVQKLTHHVNSYSNADVCIRVLCAQKFTFTHGTLDKGNREQLFNVLGSQ